jgi:CheY-like chemotaxis protein
MWINAQGLGSIATAGTCLALPARGVAGAGGLNRGNVVVILVTEDVDDNRQLMKLLLEHHGHDVDTAENGEQAIQAASKRLPDLILMDMRMPVMDGFTATRLLRTATATREVPIVALSAYVNDKRWRERAIAAGCNACIGKPVDYDDLARVISQYMK